MSDTIVYDAMLRRSTDTASGLAVEWVRDEPPMERQTHFKIIAGGKEIPFVGYYNYGEEKIKLRYPGIRPGKWFQLTSELQETNYSAVGICGSFDRDLFVKVWQNLLSQGTTYRVSTYYTEFKNRFDPLSNEEWSCEGQRQSEKP